MVVVNLIPWREKALRYQVAMTKKILTITVMMMFLILSGVHHELAQRNESLLNQVAQLNEIWTQATIEERLPDQATLLSIPMLKKLLEYRLATTTLFLELQKKQLSSVCFTAIQRANNIITFSGNTRSAAELTDYLKNWSAAHLFAEIKLDYLQQKEDGLMQFRFQASENTSTAFLATLRQAHVNTL